MFSEDPEVFYDVDPEMGSENSDFSGNDSEIDSKWVAKPKEDIYFDFPNQKPRRQCRYAQKRAEKRQGARPNPMPKIKNKTDFLELVNAYDCIKNKVTDCYLTQVVGLQRANRHTQQMHTCG